MAIFLNRTMLPVLAIAVISGAALAHQGAIGVVKKRMDGMDKIGQSMKVIGQMIHGQADYDGALVSDAALVIADHAKDIPSLFPEGSIDKPSEALPSIWQDWDEFLAIGRDLETNSRKLSVLAVRVYSASEIKVQFGEIGKTCNACHQKFRQKKQ